MSVGSPNIDGADTSRTTLIVAWWKGPKKASKGAPGSGPAIRAPSPSPSADIPAIEAEVMFTSVGGGGEIDRSQESGSGAAVLEPSPSSASISPAGNIYTVVHRERTDGGGSEASGSGRMTWPMDFPLVPGLSVVGKESKVAAVLLESGKESVEFSSRFGLLESPGQPRTIEPIWEEVKCSSVEVNRIPVVPLPPLRFFLRYPEEITDVYVPS